MIKSFRHRGLDRYFRAGSTAGIQPKHAARLRLHLARLDAATGFADMAMPGWKCHALKGELAGHWAVWVDENWRMSFPFEAEDAVLAGYRDYH